MLRLCIIDDVQAVLEDFVDQLRSNDSLNSCVDWSNSIADSLTLEDEKTGHHYSYEEQLKRVVNYIENKWDLFDLLLLDWSLFGNKDEGKTAIGVVALKNLFDKFPDFQDDINNKRKFILIVTAKNTRGVDFESNDFGGKIICVDKPTDEERNIEHALCQCPPGTFELPCKYFKKEDYSSKCKQNQCLPEIIKIIDSINGGSNV